MSWLDDLGDIVKGAGAFITGNSTASQILKTIATGYALYQLTKSMNKENAASAAAVPGGSSGSTYAPTTTPPEVDMGVRLQIEADTKTKIPVVYGQAIIGGKMFDAQMINFNQTMWYAVVLSEVTGNTILGVPSTFTFKDIYWNGQRMVFDGADGITATHTVDKNGKVDSSINGLVKVFCYANGSSNPEWIEGYTNGAILPAYSYFPGWDSTYELNQLVFALVRIDYNKEKNVTGLGQMQFKLENSMNLPGDVLYDYMTNTRYGAGIDPDDIKAQ